MGHTAGPPSQNVHAGYMISWYSAVYSDQTYASQTVDTFKADSCVFYRKQVIVWPYWRRRLEGLAAPRWGLEGNLWHSPPSQGQATCRSPPEWNAPRRCTWKKKQFRWRHHTAVDVHSSTSTIVSSPGREHTVVLSVQLVSNDLVVGAHSSLNSGSHKILRDSRSERP